MTDNIYQLNINTQTLTEAISEVIVDDDNTAPIASSERLDFEQEQRLGRLTGDIIAKLDLAEHIQTPVPDLRLGGVAVDDYYDGDGLLDGLAVMPYLVYDQPERLRTNGPVFYLGCLTRSADLGRAEELDGQLFEFARVVLGLVVNHLNKQLAFYTKVLTPA